MIEFGFTAAQKTMESEHFMEILNDDQQKFDLVIADLFDSEIYSGWVSSFPWGFYDS